MPSQQIGNIKFTYANVSRECEAEDSWFDIYYDVTLSTGEKVGQLTIAYDFEAYSEREHAAAFRVYFETEDGHIHNLSNETTKALRKQGRPSPSWNIQADSQVCEALIRGL